MNLANLSLGKRIAITLVILASPFIVGLLITYQVINIRWVSFMQIQPSFRPMENPLPLPANSVPVEGAAFVPGLGSPQNPVAADDASLARGKYLYDIDCALCHGAQGKGDGPVAEKLRRKPADLTAENVRGDDEGTIFLVITNGVSGTMPPLRENLAPRDRWDVVNYVRSLQGKQGGN